MSLNAASYMFVWRLLFSSFRSAVEKRETILQEKAERQERQKREIDRLRAEVEQVRSACSVVADSIFLS